jgi:hypothetical protein
VAVPAVMYGNEIWIVRKNLETRIQTAEKIFPNRVVGYTDSYQQHNTEIRKK